MVPAMVIHKANATLNTASPPPFTLSDALVRSMARTVGFPKGMASHERV